MFFMFGKIQSACIQGIEGQTIDVEVDISNGIPQFHIVGLPDSAIRESVERVRAAIRNSGFEFPLQRITINLAPADVRKEGAAFDLAIAAGILHTSGQLAFDEPDRCLFIGELALDGTVRGIPGVLALIDHAKNSGFKTVYLSKENADEASIITGIKLKPIEHLAQFKHNINDINDLSVKTNQHADDSPSLNAEDFADVKGHEHAKRALMIAAAGMHNILFIGPPGSGKTMLMRRLPGILPEMTENEAMEVTKIYSITGRMKHVSSLMRHRPFRSPHHTISAAGLIGGGRIPKPGEVSLAHRGVLFLDELPEFPRAALEALRQPLEDKKVTIARTSAVYAYPSDFILAASMNPCPCGYWGAESEAHDCRCTPLQIASYRSKISGPLADRIDLQVEIPAVDYLTASQSAPGMSTAQMREKVEHAHRIQLQRKTFNSNLKGRMLGEYCRLPDDAQSLMREAFAALGLSMRAYDRLLRIARTIADLEMSEHIQKSHVAEALQYRCLDRKYHQAIR